MSDETPIEPLLLTTTRVSTFIGKRPLTGASGFFFEGEVRLFLMTGRHVVLDKPTKHFPDRIEIEFHTDATNLTRSVGLSVLLYLDGKRVWRQGKDDGGEIDVAVIELKRATLPPSALLRCFTLAHLQHSLQEVEVGASLLVVGFSLGFHDELHHLPVVRQAVIALVCAFKGKGLFSHRCANAWWHQRRASGDARFGHRYPTPLETAWRALCTHGHGEPRLAP